MSLRDFIEDTVSEIEDRLGEGHQVESKDILKNNDVVMHTVTIHTQDSGIAPCIHIDDIYGQYLAGGVDISGAADRIIRSYEGCAAGPDIDVSLFTDQEGILSRVRGRLINTGMDRRLLEDIPHWDFLDLSLVYTVAAPLHGEMDGYILIHNGHLKLWDISGDDLYRAVRESMGDTDEVFFESMGTVLSSVTGQDADMAPAGCPMYILSNKTHHDGAVHMLNDHMLRVASDIMGHGDLVILPSSIHELILLPVSGEDGPGRFHELAGIVHGVNDTQVERTEVLSYHVYHYSREDAKITIAA